MAVSNATLTNLSGAASDLFKGFADSANASLKAKGLNLDAQGLRLKASGDLAEAGNYDLASHLAAQNEKFAETSTAIKMTQLDRANTMMLGGQAADVAGAGFGASGSALDLLHDSASQGALTKAVAGQQGLITEAGYQEQAQSFTTMANAGRAAAAGEQDIANKTDQLAQDTLEAGQNAMFGDFASSAIKGAATIATLFI